jgi:hypothetical protein
VQQPNYGAVNLWLANGVPQPAATASTQPMEELVATPAAREARRHHEREQVLRGDHPHDHGRYIQPPLVWSILRPIVARYRTVHVDVTGWPDWQPLVEVVGVLVLLSPAESEPLSYAAECHDGSRRRYVVELPAEPDDPGWLPPGNYGVQVLVWVAGEPEPRKWSSTLKDSEGRKQPLALAIAEEPRRPRASAQEAA